MTISRVRRPRLEAQRTYDRLSRWYDLLATGPERSLVDRGLRALDLMPDERVLEVGFGTGQALADIARVAGQVFGIDLSMGMCRQSTKRASEQGFADQMRLVQGDAFRLPFAGESFDAIFMSFALELFDTPEIVPVLVGCRRSLRPNGRLGVVSLSRSGSISWPLRAYEWGHERLPVLLDCRPILVADSMRQAGFEILACKLESMWGLPVEIVLGHRSRS